MKKNEMYFSEEQVKAGEMTEFLNILLKQCYGKSKYYNDIHIKPEDCGAFTIEWVNVPWDESYGGSFQYLDEDDRIFKEYILPDRSYVCFQFQKEYDEYFEQWMIDNPGWVKNEFGIWTNEIENKKLHEEIDKQICKEENRTGIFIDGLEENGVPQ